VPAIALAASVFMAGCGSSSKNTSSAAPQSAAPTKTTTLTRAAYIARADSICETDLADLGRLNRYALGLNARITAKTPSAADLRLFYVRIGGYYQKVASLMRSTGTTLAALEVPQELGSLIPRYLAARDARLQAYQAVAAAYGQAAKDTKNVAPIAPAQKRVTATTAEATKLAHLIGFRGCSAAQAPR
jgi:hypothetical protein